ncbi:MAG: septum formation initiator family protein [Bdellovibrionia bacterium]
MTNRIAPIWVFFALVAFATGTVSVRLNIIHITYAINEINRKIEKSRQEGEVLKLRLAALKSPKKLEELARRKFGFSQPRNEQVVHFTRGTTVNGT